MLTIECAWIFFEESEAVCVLKPSEASGSGNYVVMLWKESGVHLIYVTGLDQFNALIECLTEVGLHMSGRFNEMMFGAHKIGKQRRAKKVPISILNENFTEGPVCVKIVAASTKDKSVDFEMVLQVRNGRGGVDNALSRCGEILERIPLSEKEVMAFGEIFWSLSSAEYEPVCMSSVHDWFLPQQILQARISDEVTWNEITRQAAMHIKEKCPEFAVEWVEYIERLGQPSTDQALDKDKHLSRTIALNPWLESLLGSEDKEYEDEIGTFYTIGKDFAFDWMREHPLTTRGQLIEALLTQDQVLPTDLAIKTAEKIVERVFSVNART